MTEVDVPAPRDPPLRATHHCRHYSYEGVPTCALGIDLSAPGAGRTCWSKPDIVICDKRDEYTDAERDAYKQYAAERMIRAAVIINEMPVEKNKKADRANWGKHGNFACPGCGTGTVNWSRSRINGHIHAVCSTPNCFSIIQ